jgi:hypothetical protein
MIMKIIVRNFSLVEGSLPRRGGAWQASWTPALVRPGKVGGARRRRAVRMTRYA